MRTSKGKSKMLGRTQWMQWTRIYQRYVRNVRKNAMKTYSKGKSEMLGRMQWKHLANVSQNMLGRMQWKI